MADMKDVYVFISSTFNDMHAERDFLIKSVFPRVSDWCSERNLRLVEIDLRWGITSEESDSLNNKVVEICLENIDKCRPFFICLMGQRRGWVPTQNDIAKSTLRKISGIDKVIGKYSVTELEFLHALFNPFKIYNDNNEKITLSPAKYAWFLSRKPDYLKDMVGEFDCLKDIYTNRKIINCNTEDRIMNEFKEKLEYGIMPDIPRDRYKFEKYDCVFDKNQKSPELISVGEDDIWGQGRLTKFQISDTHSKSMEEYLFYELTNAFKKEFPENCCLIENQVYKESEKHKIFHQRLDKIVFGRNEEMNMLSDYIKGDSNTPFLIVGEGGSGKTSLLSSFVHLYEDSIELVCCRFVGASYESYNEVSLLKGIIEELINNNAINNEELMDRFYIDSLEDLISDENRILERFSVVLNCLQKKTLIIIDGINDVTCKFNEIYWLPTSVSKGSKFIISCKTDEKDVYKRVISKYTNYLELQRISLVEDRELIVDNYLSTYLKKINRNEKNEILINKSAGNPLFLKIVLSELKIFGSFDNLKNRIVGFGITVNQAFKYMLERLENDIVYSSISIERKVLIKALFGLLARSKNGMTGHELIRSIIRFANIEDYQEQGKLEIKEEIYSILRQMKDFVTYRDKRIKIMYSDFVEVINNRYIEDEKLMHKCIAEVFLATVTESDKFNSDERTMYYKEAISHFEMCGMKTELFQLFLDYKFIYKMMESCGVGLVLDSLSRLKDEYQSVGILYNVFGTYKVELIKSVKSLPTILWMNLGQVENKELKRFLFDAEKSTDELWLKAISEGNQIDQKGLFVEAIEFNEEINNSAYDYFRKWYMINDRLYIIVQREEKVAMVSIWDYSRKINVEMRYLIPLDEYVTLTNVVQARYKDEDILLCWDEESYNNKSPMFIYDIKTGINREIELDIESKSMPNRVNFRVPFLEDKYYLEELLIYKTSVYMKSNELKSVYCFQLINHDQISVKEVLTNFTMDTITVEGKDIYEFEGYNQFLIIKSFDNSQDKLVLSIWDIEKGEIVKEFNGCGKFEISENYIYITQFEKGYILFDLKSMEEKILKNGYEILNENYDLESDDMVFSRNIGDKIYIYHKNNSNEQAKINKVDIWDAISGELILEKDNMRFLEYIQEYPSNYYCITERYHMFSRRRSQYVFIYDTLKNTLMELMIEKGLSQDEEYFEDEDYLFVWPLIYSNQELILYEKEHDVLEIKKITEDRREQQILGKYNKGFVSRDGNIVAFDENNSYVRLWNEDNNGTEYSLISLSSDSQIVDYQFCRKDNEVLSEGGIFNQFISLTEDNSIHNSESLLEENKERIRKDIFDGDLVEDEEVFEWSSFDDEVDNFNNLEFTDILAPTVFSKDEIEIFDDSRLRDMDTGLTFDIYTGETWFWGIKIDELTKRDNGNYLMEIDGQIFEMELKNCNLNTNLEKNED